MKLVPRIFAPLKRYFSLSITAGRARTLVHMMRPIIAAGDRQAGTRWKPASGAGVPHPANGPFVGLTMMIRSDPGKEENHDEPGPHA